MLNNIWKEVTAVVNYSITMDTTMNISTRDQCVCLKQCTKYNKLKL